MLYISIFVLDLHNLTVKTMKNRKKRFMITFISIMVISLGYIYLDKGTELFKGLELIIVLLITIAGIIALIRVIKKDKNLNEGLPEDDELSTKIKYKSGYYAYMATMYIWVIIFILKDLFPDKQSMLGGGILLSALISFVAKYFVKKNFYE